MSYNIRQKTNFDFDLAEGEPKDVYVGGELREGLTYKSITFENKVPKLGYCANDNEGMNYPIFLVFDGEGDTDHEFQIGKTGMFEFQPEDWDDVNNPRSEDDPATVYVTKIKVYEDIPFVVDYCYEV